MANTSAAKLAQLVILFNNIIELKQADFTTEHNPAGIALLGDEINNLSSSQLQYITQGRSGLHIAQSIV